MKCENIFAAIPEQIDEEIFEVLAENKQVKIERIISKGHRSPEDGWYDQENNEWVIVLQGEATLQFFEGELVKLTAGSYVNIPAHRKHKVASTSEETETIWLAVHY